MAKPQGGIPDNVMQLLAAADARQGFPKGTMAGVMQQEVGGNFGKYLNDPSTYHYGLNADGKRIAGHTGKVSTAFGPFGILESTGADPGYGVAPLKGKDLAEQIRFASDYLGARSKRSGGLEQGLAGYGEGAKYGAQVVARVNGVKPSQSQRGEGAGPVTIQQAVAEPSQPVAVAASGSGAPAQVVQPVVNEMPPVQVAQAPAQENTWTNFTSKFERPPVQAGDLAYGQGTRPPSYAMGVLPPDFMAAVAGARGGQVNFQSLRGFGARG